MKKQIAAGLGLTVLAMTGCSSIEKDASDGTVESLGKAVSQVLDIECGKGSGNSAQAGWDQDTCGDQAIIGVFTNAETQKEVRAKNPSGSGAKIVEGSNWIVWAKNGSEAEIQDRLGGQIVEPPQLFKAVLNLEFAPSVPSYVVQANGASAKKCFAQQISPYKDLGERSTASLTTNSGLELEGDLIESNFFKGTCFMRYEVKDVPAGDEPYSVSIGHRPAPDQTERELRDGAKLFIGK